MKLEDSLEITQSYHGLPAEVEQFCSITDHPIIDLIGQLDKKGIKIDYTHSEMSIDYKAKTSIEESTVPLRTSFHEADEIRIKAYYLRNDNLEIKLKDYRNITSNSPEGFIGGTVSGETGIVVELKYLGANEEGAKIINKAKTIIKEFYHPLTKAIAKALRKVEVPKELLPER